MLLNISSVLNADEVVHFNAVLSQTRWIDGSATSGIQSALVKNNLQVPEDAPEAKALGETILRALGSNAMFSSATLPLRVFPPLFNRYDVGMEYGTHVDNAIRHIASARQMMRTDISCTLFLTDPAEYDGGELVIGDGHGDIRVKLAAGDMVVYPADSLHRVEPITRGSRWASFFWVQSMVRDNGDRALLHRFDQAITAARVELGDKHASVLGLTSTYHNLLRKWIET